MQFLLSDASKKNTSNFFLVDDLQSLDGHLSKKELTFVTQKWKENSWVDISDLGSVKVIGKLTDDLEENRKLGAQLQSKITADANIIFLKVKKLLGASLLEGLFLADYSFSKYKSEKEKLKELKVNIDYNKLDAKYFKELLVTTSAVKDVRDLVNEPVNHLNTEAIIDYVKGFKDFGVNVEVYRKSRISSLNMGGILGVNQGSNEEPALLELTYKPEKAKEKDPIVLVGKGILFDTGGINIKTGNFMTDMKADMGGAATVLGIMQAAAKNKLPINLKALLPITENRINGNELVPGDVIKMHNGKTVEVLNTDAEGRLVLADALSFAQKFKPRLIIDNATLTGSAFRTTGHNGAVVMGTAKKEIKKFVELGDTNYERLIELPMWKEFGKSLESNVADINNLGSGEGQAVCAGLFLKHFVGEFPWLHLDIAGPAFIPADVDYKKKGGTGFGVRLGYAFLKAVSLK